MSNVLKFTRRPVSVAEREERSQDECTHRQIKVHPVGSVVCSLCGAMLSPFWALAMLSKQYGLALAQIDRLNARLALADARVLKLSEELDALAPSERASKQSPTET
ncbi:MULTISPECIES: hypothetical protein [unclassified Caballeronia]|uniref:hypothetical protein n=1 Tax=unclassified Caballeronia TaxID=2646786 RepID=UPI0028617E90|nr:MULTISPECIES: hypothetical protein [unclassified Caballeronia]MDR5776900.1 hypothetical protein [Caballeronia sp. LZ002]MDR5798794.1 hypothetical protein [Caballeronia sp. LZ001]MDR5852315.1 hypothetical protein [Caballeronia sp. LZ003]